MKKIKYCLLALPCLFEKVLAKGLRLLLPVIVCLCSVSLKAQYSNTNNTKGHISAIQEAGLMVGDLVPDIPLLGEARNKLIPNTLADYRGKYLLIDFWATWCAPCYAKFSLLDSFQKKNADRLQIIAISREKPGKVSEFLKKRKLDAVSFNILAGDTIFNDIFQHYLIPHIIWVSPAGKVQYITGGTSLTAANLHQWVNGMPIYPVTKIDFMDYNTKMSIQANVPHAKKSLQISRNFYKRIPGLPGGAGIHRTDSSLRYYITNSSVEQMYARALLFSLPYPYRQLRLNVKDLTPFENLQVYENWLSLNTYCYEVISSKSLNDTLFANLLLEDLNQNLGYKTYWEKNPTEAWVLYRINKGKKLKSSTQTVPLIKWQAEGKLLTMQCETIASLIDYLNRQPTSLIEPPLFFDDTGIDHHVDISIILQDADDFDALNQALRSYGLILKKGRRVSSQLVIADVR